MEKRSPSVGIRMLRNIFRMLGLAWQASWIITSAYYFTSIMGTLFPLGTALILKYLLDNMIKSTGSGLIGISAVSFSLAVLLATRYFLSFCQSVILTGLNNTYLSNIFYNMLQKEIGYRVYEKIARLDIVYFEDSETLDLIQRTDEGAVWAPVTLSGEFSPLLGSIIAYCSAFIILLSFGWWIPFIGTVICLPRLYLQLKYGKLRWSLYGVGAPLRRKLSYFRTLMSNENHLREMKILQSREPLLAQFKNIQEESFQIGKKSLDRFLRKLSLPLFFEVAIFCVMVSLQLPGVLVGSISVGGFTLLITLLDYLRVNTRDASISLSVIYDATQYVEDLFALLTLPPIIKEINKPVVFEEIAPPTIEFRHVSFCYPNGREVLKDVSFTIQPGESVALVGANGAGKSTIIKLLCRFYDVTSGEILINGINLKELSLAQWYRFLSTLFQDFVRYQFSVGENIVLGNKAAPFNEELMEEAACKSRADDFIKRLPKGFEQQLGRQFEEGEELSAGQWQKLAIARAFYRQAPVLILDEPTSAIDAEAEQEIFDNLRQIYAGKTLLLVSHRFSTVRNTNKIYVIEDGCILEQGNHEQLLELNGKYASMFLAQAKGYM